MKEDKIYDYDIYNESMRKSMLDKIFFMDKIDSKVIVDYGCADGTLIHFLSMLFPEYQYIGFDIDQSMLDQAKKRCKGMGNCIFTRDWREVSIYCDNNTTVLLSSVIHEVYAYGTRADVDSMWKRVFEDFKYVVIRDMIPSISIDKKSDINDVRSILGKGHSGSVRDFEHNWGSIEQNKNLVHFLLKYRYTDNWEREVKENYFPVSRELILSSIPYNFNIEFHEHFILPFIKNVIKEDFDIELKDNTHLKLILKRK